MEKRRRKGELKVSFGVGRHRKRVPLIMPCSDCSSATRCWNRGSKVPHESVLSVPHAEDASCSIQKSASGPWVHVFGHAFSCLHVWLAYDRTYMPISSPCCMIHAPPKQIPIVRSTRSFHYTELCTHSKRCLKRYAKHPVCHARASMLSVSTREFSSSKQKYAMFHS